MSGYVYILENPSMPALLKIGKTTRTPEIRAKELSSVTSVPIPFNIVYKEEFNDCDYAENYIHDILSINGFRVSKNREFFEIDINKAIKIVKQAKKEINSLNKNGFSENYNKELEMIFEKGLKEIQINKNSNKAIKYFNKAIKLGHKESCFFAGYEYLYEKQNFKKALLKFNKGAAADDQNSLARLVLIFLGMSPDYLDIENAKKWRERFFENLNINKVSEWYIYFFSNYVNSIYSHKDKISFKYKDKLSFFKDVILNDINKSIEEYKRDNNDEIIKYLKKSKQYFKENIPDITPKIKKEYNYKETVLEIIDPEAKKGRFDIELNNFDEDKVSFATILRGKLAKGDKIIITNRYGEWLREVKKIAHSNNNYIPQKKVELSSGAIAESVAISFTGKKENSIILTSYNTFINKI